jgi:hypothetical protein
LRYFIEAFTASVFIYGAFFNVLKKYRMGAWLALFVTALIVIGFSAVCSLVNF